MISMRIAALLLWAGFAWRPEICGVAQAFTSHHPLAVRSSSLPPLPSSSLPTPTEQEQALGDYLPPEHPLYVLLGATADACAPRRLDTTEDVHEAFRYEWGTWCSTDKLDAVLELLGEIRLVTGAYEDLMDGNLETTPVGKDADSANGGESGKETGKRIRIAGGKYYDVLLHVLPKGARYQHKWPEGSWTIVQPLTGLTEVAQLRGPDRDGFYSKMRPRDIRGGGDGSGSLGAGPTEGAEGYSTAGRAVSSICCLRLGRDLRCDIQWRDLVHVLATAVRFARCGFGRCLRLGRRLVHLHVILLATCAPSLAGTSIAAARVP